MKPPLPIEWSQAARDDLARLYLHIAPQNPAAALALHQRIIGCISLLAARPHIGRPGRVPGTRELVIANTAYIVPYRVSGKRLQILRVYHSSSKWPESLPGDTI